MLGHKRIPSREGGIEIVVEELSTRMVTLGHKVTCYNRSGHHVSGKDFDGGKRKAYKGVRLKSVLTLDKKGLAAMTASVSGAICAAFGKYDVVHFHAEGPCAMLWLPKLFGKRCIATVHKERIQWFASKQSNAHDVFFVGRGIDYAICMEGSLKMKEISYIHSEAYAAGELKHGTISLIEDDILVVGVLTQPDLYEKTISNMVECRSRGAYLMGLTTFGQYNIEDSTDFAVYIPKIDPHFATSLAVIPLQLLGYYISVAKGLDVDKPRNLAKSVTVE